MQSRKNIFFAIVIVLFFCVLFIDQNSTQVPVKILFGDPWSVGLSTVIITSMLVGVALSLGGIYALKRVRKANKNLNEGLNKTN